ncbi:sensor domain-containing protein [Streptacidiphilus sp. EB129]|uniref:sensor domain-containing protein n=1 Tax=Streptacidiphilus sp. EB129 TaxID=3156262 RepID=UPI003517E159
MSSTSGNWYLDHRADGSGSDSPSGTASGTGYDRQADREYDYDGFPVDRDLRDRRAGGGERLPVRQPNFLSAPFSARTWRETLHLVLNLPIGILTFSCAVTLFVAGVGTVLTFVGLPVLAVLIVTCRGFGAMERARAASTLDLRVTAPEPLRPARPGIGARLSAALLNGPGWRSMLYSVLMLPMAVLSFSATVLLWTFGIGYASYPLWQWVFPTYADMPGLQLYSHNGHTVYLSSAPQIAGVCLAGLLVMFVTPWVVRALANLQRLMVRGLLSA